MLGLSEVTLEALNRLGIQTPTEIQEKAIPILLEENCDFLGLAQTGTGKTAAYGLPLIEKIDPDKREIQALIITPTRELGQQVAEQLLAFSKFKKGISVEVVYGGKPIDRQIQFLRRKPQIVVATPGRLLDLISRRALSLQTIRYVILDEADEMLNMGFQEDIDKILSLTPDYKKVWLFSATMPAEIRHIAQTYMTDHKEVRINSEEKVNVNISHEYIRLKGNQKFEALSKLIEANPEMRAVVFCKTRMDTQELSNDLYRAGFEADAIHGDLSQNQRDKVMNKFKTNKLQFLIATDVAARGIDVKDLTHVVHYALPQEMEYYTHRSGRTGRAGKLGISISLITGSEFSRMKFFSQKLQIDFKESPLQEFFAFDPYEGGSDRRGGGGRGRSGGGRSFGGSGGGRSYGGNSRNESRSYGDRDNNRSSGGSGYGRREDSRPSFGSNNRGSDSRAPESRDRDRNRDSNSGSDRRSRDGASSRPAFEDRGGFSGNRDRAPRGDKPFGEKRYGDKKPGSKPAFAGSSYDKKPAAKNNEAGSVDKYRRKAFDVGSY